MHSSDKVEPEPLLPISITPTNPLMRMHLRSEDLLIKNLISVIGLSASEDIVPLGVKIMD